MEIQDRERPAILIVDMVKDNFDPARPLPITPFAKALIGPINRLIAEFRKMQWPVVFPTDAFQKEDFIFKGRMAPHSIAGTEGAEVIDELDRRAEDLWLPKPRFSAFFNTHLAEWLKERDVTLCAVSGIATNFCILSTALDAVCHDFKTVLLEDCTAAASRNMHEQTLNLYRRNPLYPLFRIADSKQFLRELIRH